MAKSKVRYECSNCGATYANWAGKCTNCGEWNTIAEQLDVSTVNVKSSGKRLEPESVKVMAKASSDVARIKTHDTQLDTVLGGGLVPGSVVLLAGQPGIGKSTILMQIAQSMSAKVKVLYVSGEESAHQRTKKQKGQTAAMKGWKESINPRSVTLENLRTLLEQDLDQAELVLAAKDMVDRIQKMAEILTNLSRRR